MQRKKIKYVDHTGQVISFHQCYRFEILDAQDEVLFTSEDMREPLRVITEKLFDQFAKTPRAVAYEIIPLHS